MNLAILGAGKIAGTMADTVCRMREAGRDSVRLYAVAARDGGRAAAFAAQYGIPVSYGSYEEMAKDPQVDLVYVATPHSHHAEHMKLCIENGKHILCEKAFTANAKQAEEVFALAKEKGVLVCEAIWTRYQPMRAVIRDLAFSGIVGAPRSIQADLSYPIEWKARITEPELAGGALLDVGVYAINFAEMVFGRPDAVCGHAVLSDKGVDMTNSMTFVWNDGRMGILSSGATALSEREGIIRCENGFLRVSNINNPERVIVYNRQYEEIRRIERPDQLTGYEYEVEEAARCIEQGLTECPSMPWDETLHIMREMDELRRQMGVHYPFED
ncbi:MAG: Gfo/Idh/MocA family oxidoreductase [Clostridia bacterium]|nr:Gfo/Idh/MocA family oxidoreductase [Clostridia bacterium]